MNDTRTPAHLWIVGIVSLLWNAFGGFDYTATQLRMESYISQFSEAQIAYFTGMPVWVDAAWAFGVWGAVLGSIALLLRKSWAVWLFGLSLLGLLVSTIYNFGMSGGAEIFGTMGIIMSVVIWIVAIFLFLYARAMSAKGVLR